MKREKPESFKQIKITRKEFRELITDLLETKKKLKDLNEKYTHAIIIDDD